MVSTSELELISRIKEYCRGYEIQFSYDLDSEVIVLLKSIYNFKEIIDDETFTSIIADTIAKEFDTNAVIENLICHVIRAVSPSLEYLDNGEWETGGVNVISKYIFETNPEFVTTIRYKVESEISDIFHAISGIKATKTEIRNAFKVVNDVLDNSDYNDLLKIRMKYNEKLSIKKLIRHHELSSINGEIELVILDRFGSKEILKSKILRVNEIDFSILLEKKKNTRRMHIYFLLIIYLISVYWSVFMYGTSDTSIGFITVLSLALVPLITSLSVLNY